MSYESLEDVLHRAGNPVELLRGSQVGPYAFPGVRPEFTNWRDEQRAWRETCALFDQSYHLTDLYVDGPDALALLTSLGVNSFRTFAAGQAKQFVACNHDGHVIGDAILFYLDERRFSLVGRPSALNWVHYHAETGGARVTVQRDERSAINPGTRRVYRYQIQGPNAPKVMEAATGAPVPDVRFFRLGVFSIGGHQVRALRHGMVGQPGWELFGPWEQGDAVRRALLDAGRQYGIRQVGSRAYPTTCLESGWIPSPLPAVYAGDALKPYRQWLRDTSYEATASLGGSFIAGDITAYYLTPWELGYGSLVRFDHDFIGRGALEAMATRQRRTKVTLIWNGDDLAGLFDSLSRRDGDIAKYVDLPLANYSTLPFDTVMTHGTTIGVSTYTGYTYNERAMVSLAVIDRAYSRLGTEVSIVWGEEGGGSSKPTVERHRQSTIRATVAPVPLSEVARFAYRPATHVRAHP